MSFETVISVLVWVGIFLTAVTVHEVSHGAIAFLRGDQTAKAMGRLTLNVLLSFAQFEREVIAERVRDKFLASRRKGMWMGGTVPLGYDVNDRKLVINADEADRVA